MKAQKGNIVTLTKQLKKVFYYYSTVFQKCGKTQEEINISLIKST